MNTHVRERAIFVQSSLAFLTRLDAMIEELIAMRDALDGDADFEPEAEDDDGDAEPTLGAPESVNPWDLRHAWARGSTFDGEAEVTIATARERESQEHFAETYAVADDCEDSHDAEDDRADEEPTLGAPERHGPSDAQADWAQGDALNDGEAEITMPTASGRFGIGGSQDVDARACGYAAPDDAEVGGDQEQDDEHGEGAPERDS